MQASQRSRCSASRRITGLGSDSRYNRTARARISSGYFFGASTKESFHGHQTMIKSLRETGKLRSTCCPRSRRICPWVPANSVVLACMAT